jgi:hypothetical protein
MNFFHALQHPAQSFLSESTGCYGLAMGQNRYFATSRYNIFRLLRTKSRFIPESLALHARFVKPQLCAQQSRFYALDRFPVKWHHLTVKKSRQNK